MSDYYKLPGDPSLPPGCTHADIDRAMGGEDDEPAGTCDYCGGRCRPGRAICRECAAAERAERERDEEKDNQQ